MEIISCIRYHPDTWDSLNHWGDGGQGVRERGDFLAPSPQKDTLAGETVTERRAYFLKQQKCLIFLFAQRVLVKLYAL